MNSQTPSPDDGQSTEPLPGPAHQPTEPLPPHPAKPSDAAARPANAGESSAAGDQTGSSAAGAGPYTGSFPSPSFPNPAGGYAAPTPAPTDFFTWVRGHGIYRGSDRWVGGVSSGIAHRLNVDPVIIRGVFIVLTLFAGIGVLLYGLAWAFLPEPDGRIHVQEAGAGRWSTGMTGALIATILGLTGLGGGFWGWRNNGFGGFLWAVFWIGAAIYLVYYLSQRNRVGGRAAMAGSQPGTAYTPGYGSTYPASAQASPFSATDTSSGPAAGSPATPSYGGASVGGTASGSSAYGGAYGGGAGGAGGPGGGNPYGNYPPPQGAPRPQKPRPAGPGAPAIAIAAGAALLVGGGLKALDTFNVINLGDSPNAVVWASAAAVLGLGILISGLRGRTAGILSLFAVVALVAGSVYNVVGDGDRTRFQQLNWNPTSVDEARNGLDVAGSSGSVDLTGLATNAPLTSDVVVPLDIAASNVRVIIPDNVPVDIKADMTMGNLNENGGHRGGITNRETSYNSDEPGSHLIVEIDGAFSNVTIEEGN